MMENIFLDLQIPSYILQPLVENSIKHAIAQSEKGGLIGINARVAGQMLEIEVIDDGPGPPAGGLAEKHPMSIGVGMKNIRGRLREIYGDRHALSISKREPQGCKVMVTIPYETK